MLRDSPVFSSFSVNDLNKAKKFYGQTLGLEIQEDTDMELLEIKLSNGRHIMIYPKDNHIPATFTILNFPIINIEKIVDDLTSQGVKFEQYDMPYIKTNDKGIAIQGDRKMAWFTDPAGNILSLIESKT